MNWIVNLFTNTESVAHIALLYAIVIAIGEEINNPIHVFVLKSENYIPVVYQIILEFMFSVACFK